MLYAGSDIKNRIRDKQCHQTNKGYDANRNAKVAGIKVGIVYTIASRNYMVFMSMIYVDKSFISNAAENDNWAYLQTKKN